MIRCANEAHKSKAVVEGAVHGVADLAINRNMTMIQGMVNQLTDNGNKTMDSTRELASSNEQLVAIVGQFKLK